MLSKEQAYEVIDRVLAKVKGYQALILINAEETGLTRFANSEIHQNVFKDDLELEIQIKREKKTARISTNQLDEDSLKVAVNQVIANLEIIPAGEIELPLVDYPTEIAVEEVDPGLEQNFAVEKRAELIKQGLSQLGPDYQAAGSLALNKKVLALGNSNGIKRYARGDTVSFNTVVMHQSGVSGYAESLSDQGDDLDLLAQFELADRKARTGLEPVNLEPGAYTVILEPLAVGDLLSYLAYTGFSGRSVQKGMSFLAGKIGEKVFGENITITDNHLDQNTISIPFDFEGAARKKVRIIERGRAKELVYDLASSIRDQVITTGHSVGNRDLGGFPINLVMDGGDKSRNDLIAGTERGILVTRFHYMNIIDPRQALFTGLTRDGTYLIEQGTIKTGIKNLRFTESMLQAFNRVTGISKERQKVPHFYGYSYVPALKIDDFHFTGRTEENKEGF